MSLRECRAHQTICLREILATAWTNKYCSIIITYIFHANNSEYLIVVGSRIRVEFDVV